MPDGTWDEMKAELNALDKRARELLNASDQAYLAENRAEAKQLSDAYHQAIRGRNAAMLRWYDRDWGPTEIGRCFEQVMRRTYVSRLIARAREDLRTGNTPA